VQFRILAVVITTKISSATEETGSRNPESGSGVPGCNYHPLFTACVQLCWRGGIKGDEGIGEPGAECGGATTTPSLLLASSFAGEGELKGVRGSGG